MSLDGAASGTYQVQTAYNGSSAIKTFEVQSQQNENYCIIITSIKVLDSSFSEVTSVQRGRFYNIRVANKNTCNQSVDSMQIVQVLKNSLPMNVGTVTSTISPGVTSTITVGFTMPTTATLGTYNVNAFNWNHWIEEDPATFRVLSSSLSSDFQVT